jgi:16S rRNA (adenine1518-N6/adenine1519-N6)-dimethyltransferase
MSRPRYLKALGQHHLRSAASCQVLVAALSVEGRPVVEVGPGGGVLTRPLLDAGAARIMAIERDPAWAFELGRRVKDRRLSTVVQDALDLAWEALPEGTLLAGNLPYNVGTVILEEWLKRATASPRAGVMVQWEVAERLCAAVGDPAYGALSVLVASRATTRLLDRVPKGAFVPPPKVDGGLVLIDRKPPRQGLDLDSLEITIKAAFSQRRKMLRNSLSSRFGPLATRAALADAGIAETARAEQLGLAEFEGLATALGRRALLD